MPHSPKTTEGTTASRSTMYTIGFLSQAGAIWVMKSATPTLTGTDTAIAMTEV